MKSSREISCIIPFWNEDNNLIVVLDEISKAKNIDEIICVDDGSDKDNSDLLLKKYPHIKLIRLNKNSGKSAAVREGLRHSRGKFVFLLDADIKNLDHHEIDRAIDVVRYKDDIDMLILRRINASFFIRLYRADVLFTGERILKKDDMLIILNGSVHRWQLESAINTWMTMNKKNVYWIPQSGINTQKYEKWGLVSGLKLDMKTFADMITATGFSNFVKQLFFFGKDELKEFKSSEIESTPEEEYPEVPQNHFEIKVPQDS